MDKLRAHYTGSAGSSLLTDRYKFWTSSQGLHEFIQEWEVKVRHAGSLCGYGDVSYEFCRDKFIFGLNEDNIRTELLRTHIKPNNSEKSLSDVVAEARAIESAKQTNKLIADSSKGIDQHVHWIGLRHSQMKLRREPGTCFWCCDRRGPHPWKLCPANGKTCTSCGGNDHFAHVCLEDRKLPNPSNRPTWRPQCRGLQGSQKRDPRQLQIQDIIVQYADTFKGFGRLGPPVHFQLDDSVQPVQMPVNRILVAKRAKEKEALDRCVQAGVLVKVHEPTPWCSNELIREIPKKFRICIDPSQTVNKAIQFQKHQMSTLNEQLHKLSAAKCFSLVDVKEGFLHIPLDEESSWMTTTHISYGKYWWLRLPFAITSAPDEFQMRLTSALEGLDGIIGIADDIVVYGEGNTFEEAQADQRSIKLNVGKLRFKLKEFKFMGTIISDNGLKTDPDKVPAITQMATPQNKPALLRFIGMVNYLSPFCSNLSSVIQPLRMLTQDATDASDSAVGGALLQPSDDDKLQTVAFTATSMNPTEQRYSQIEKECLAICNCFEKFDQWLMEMESDYNTRNPRLTANTENQLREEKSKDTTLNTLYKVTVKGWPADRASIPESLRPYWNYRDELSVKNGIIYKGSQVMVPQSMQKDMLRKIYANHFGPWQIVSQDLCELEKQRYLVTVCHFSDWIEVDKLEDTLSSTVIEETKAHFARYGVPAICHSDNGPQFISEDYRKFSVEYGFRHTTSSPYHPKGNGRAEAAVKVAESMLKKADDCHSAVTQKHAASRRDSKTYYDKSAGVDQRPLITGTYAYAKPPAHQRGKPWICGEVLTHEQPRSYTIRTAQGRTIRRNRVQLKPAAPPSCHHRRAAVEASTPHTAAWPPSPDAPPQENAPEMTPPQPQELTGSPVKQTRSGRIIKCPERLRHKLVINFEAITEKVHGCKPNNDKSYTKAYQKPTDCGYGCKVVCCYDDKYTKPIQIYRGPYAVYKFMGKMLEEVKYCKKIIKNKFNKP
ncbi:uncharacterized protein [Montipora foliosa]|uniref:uncharacterized protein n=1 Tax=Montipora foliosa TaxID=591990 RepID=UPI0035F1B0DD